MPQRADRHRFGPTAATIRTVPPAIGAVRPATRAVPAATRGVPWARALPWAARARLAATRAIPAALLVVVAGCDAGAVPATPPITPGFPGTPRQVNVILKDYLFEPAIVDLVPGETVRLNVVNGGLDTHELVIGTQAVQDAWAAAERPAANPPPGPTPAVAVPPGLEGIRIVVASGEIRSITWTVPADAGSLLLGCHIGDHYERGMAGLVRAVGPGGSLLAAPPGSSGTPASAVP